ncbi:tryptophan synthase subunit alpha [Candidatus Caldatribacterium sp.]|uniref:tryptophan synthase subunit alpha n=1 Tax=Candidatus Caldatribacterium sp. TaxID=2282143 RepID=UPI00299844DA|nr:tryptophan synthase subunit alpha [Candidatus Caldatribacterium sp.]MDW8080544.1 tryptophan synthase subunit alpha [Candidatus Calescibacterium sp.]
MDSLRCILTERRRIHKLFVPYLTFGYPDVASFCELLRVCEEEGADAVEVGIPHSDPVADGPVIQTTSFLALKQGVTPRMIPEVLSRFRLSIPLIAMTYGNIVLQYGVAQFAKDYQEAGFFGLIVADFPLEAWDFLEGARGILSRILLASVTSPLERVRRIAEQSEGFVYLVSGKGVTGKAEVDLEALAERVAYVKRHVPVLVLPGFGIHHPHQARHVATYTDGVIVGTAILQYVMEHKGEKDLIRGFASLLRSYREALDGA